MGMRDDDIVKEATPSAPAELTAAENMQRIIDETRQKRVPSDPDRDTSGDSVYKPEPGRTMSGDLDMRDPVGPDSPVTINGFQTVQVMPLSQYDPDKDLLIVNVMIGKMRPDRAKEYLMRIKDEIELCVKPTGWKHIMFVPITYDHPMHRQFRTVNVVDLHGLSDNEQHEVIEKVRDQLKKKTNERHISGRDILDGMTIDDIEPLVDIDAMDEKYGKS